MESKCSFVCAAQCQKTTWFGIEALLGCYRKMFKSTKIFQLVLLQNFAEVKHVEDNHKNEIAQICKVE